MFSDSQQSNSSLVGVEEFGDNVNAYKLVAVAVEMPFSIFANSEKNFSFVLSEINKLFFEIFFIKSFAMFAFLVWCEGRGHGGLGVLVFY